MKNIIIYLFAIVAFSSCNNSDINKNTPSFTVSRSELHSSPDFYMFAFHSINQCGMDLLSPENVNKIIKADGGMDCGDAFCCKTITGYRMFTARHILLGCDDNINLKIENYDVVSLPLGLANNGFEIAKPEKGSSVNLKGFRIINGIVEWLELSGKLQIGTLKDFSEECPTKVTWNPGEVWLIKVDSTLNHDNMKGFSGSPIFNKDGKVVACFSGIYSTRGGRYLSEGTYLRVEELLK